MPSCLGLGYRDFGGGWRPGVGTCFTSAAVQWGFCQYEVGQRRTVLGLEESPFIRLHESFYFVEIRSLSRFSSSSFNLPNQFLINKPVCLKER